MTKVGRIRRLLCPICEKQNIHEFKGYFWQCRGCKNEWRLEVKDKPKLFDNEVTIRSEND